MMRKGFALVLFLLLLGPVGTANSQEQSTAEPFTKLNSEGKELPADAPQWVTVRDNTTGMVWEVKTTDGSIHDRERSFDWNGAHDEFLAELNQTGFGGFTDWRLPTTSELQVIRVKGAEPYINQDFFPQTVPTSYMSWRRCGNGEIYDERVKFGKQRNTKKDRKVRAVRGGKEVEAK